MSPSTSSVRSSGRPRSLVASWLLILLGTLLLVGAPSLAAYNSLNAAGIHPGTVPDEVVINEDGTGSHYLISLPQSSPQDLVWPGVVALVGAGLIGFGLMLLFVARAGKSAPSAEALPHG